MRLVFLGTSAGTPTRERNVSAVAVCFDDGRTWLADCGEGTQHRMQTIGVRAGSVERVLLTHLHGDHCWGLPGLLASQGLHGREGPLQVAGPRGLRDWLEATFRAAQTHLPYPLSLRELPDGGGNLETAAGGNLETAAGGGRGETGPQPAWSATAVPLVHRVTSFAWVLREAPRRGRFDAVRADALGVPAGPARGELAAGCAVTLRDGRRVVPEDVLGDGRPGRAAILCGDSADSRSLLGVEAARGCDVLVHECTFDAGRVERAHRLGHSTSADVAALAHELAPRRLVLTHVSPRYDADAAEGLRHEVVERWAAAREAPERHAVVLAHDGLALDVPPRE